MKKHYDIKPILKLEADYNMINGRRSNGKSYAVKELALWEAYHERDYLTNAPKVRYELAYGRRWRDELKRADVESYFDDSPINKITGGDYTTVAVYQNDIYFANISDETGKKVRGKKIGHCFALTSSTHYKSLTYPKIGNYIFEEYMSENAQYLPRDVSNLESIISTIARNDKIRVFLIGNTINPVCPYFREWGLQGAINQKEGTIDIYKKPTAVFDYAANKWVDSYVKIAVEKCAQTSEVGLMAFGRRARSINGTEWETEEHAHLLKPFNAYEVKYQILYKYDSFKFVIDLLRDKETREITLFVYPFTGEADASKIKRRVTDEYTTTFLHTAYLTILNGFDKLVLELIERGKVCYSDNLTGTEFLTIKKNKGRY